MLFVQIGIGYGNCTISIMGGVSDRWECLLTGNAQQEAFNSCDNAKSREVIISQSVQDRLGSAGISVELSSVKGIYKLETVQRPDQPSSYSYHEETLALTMASEYVKRTMLQLLPCFAPAQAKIVNNAGAELRTATIVFVDVKPSLDPNEHPNALNKPLRMMQRITAVNGGEMRQFIVDDKGCVFIGVYGLPGGGHADNSVKAIRASMCIVDGLASKHSCNPSIGIATGKVMCGTVGCLNRQEYAVIGDAVNLAARLMSHFEVSNHMNSIRYVLMR